VDDLQATGTGRSKKYAKHLAAKNLLDRLVASGRHFVYGIPYETDEEALEFIRSLLPEQEQPQSATQVVPMNATNEVALPSAVSSADDASNPVGTLQEICMRKKWPPADYYVVDERGLPHDKIFTVKITLGKYQEMGHGKTKKAAKRDAADKMIDTLTELENQQKNRETVVIRNREEELSDKFVQVMTDLGHKVKKLVPDDISAVKSFFDYLKAKSDFNFDQMPVSLDEQLANLQKINFVQILQTIAKTGGFEVIFVDVKHRAFNGEFQCLVQITAKPLAVAYGSGPTPDDAKQNASYHALEYLKIVTAD